MALAALSKDLGKSRTEALLAEVYGVKAEANGNKKFTQLDENKRVAILCHFFTKSWQLEPKGSVLIISPWNYPIMPCLNPLIAAISLVIQRCLNLLS